MNSLERRLSALELRKAQAVRRVHVICAIDEVDRDSQVAEMVSAGLLASSDGLLCITGRPAVRP
jgi:hypothetical protein